MPKPIRALVVDDSLVMRSLLRMVLASDPAIELAGMATDGAAALDAMDHLKPDVVLLDIEMPRMNGLEVLVELRSRRCRPKVIMCSTLTRRGAAITLEALGRGATDYVTKPTAQNGAADAVATLTRDLLPRIKALFPAPQAGTARANTSNAGDLLHAKQPEMVVIGVSTGGPAALQILLPKLPKHFPVPIVIVQHMPQLFTALLAERLDRECSLTVREAAPAMLPEPGTVSIARGDWHLEFARRPFSQGRMFRLSQAPPEHYCRPSVDTLFRSAADAYGDAVIGVVLTGMGSDGLEGCKSIRDAGGKVIVQDSSTSAVWGMPGVVAEAGLAHRILPLPAIAGELMRLCSASSHSAAFALKG
ncbi:chemotaxis response regulator protein-glutamate methylesterase [Alloacidobacterium sp.]|uniref:protein-glutamate methylesterase/protein-glutamine glutaminase n=1 Tax=Alloacidobacterium sp. TaxID=2951999 RepID=UPI002D544CF1|nr:chemotaxis response regulator protein-glutamate methylesterase [Alloacidobacterium sp.]HYK37998.1 chemotaxis response regulator protein-glutamate methylesterase [Alloacidobacterium sp.]